MSKRVQPHATTVAGRTPAITSGSAEPRQANAPSSSGEIVVRLAPLTPDEIEAVAQRLAALLLRQG